MEVTKTQAKDLLEQEATTPVDIQPFKQISDYTTFLAEYTIKGADIVFHFFQTAERPAAHYWKKTFPQCLDVSAREFFRASHPTLEASYVEGVHKSTSALNDPALTSWWLIAHGFGRVPDPQLLAETYLEKLDAALDVARDSVVG